MTRITTGCPRCGRVELEVGDVTLVVSPREDTSWYLFDCVGCARRVVKPAPSTVATALTAVHTPVWTVPAEVLERVGPREEPALAVDDLLDALIVLRGRADLVALASGAAPGVLPGPTGAAAPGEVTNPSPGGAGNRRARPNAA